ncbi:hypothetical protein FA13DRAFT_1085141 [Coprinellus micaceus]|uniref:Uncharacterized protein n=1 Tax=Coprinellus micaceus TaxID=71717 RepID=A0A4Y7TRI3_COPMI|nr:hypothetical protein FA13DRAFT_1085141 [Coprinellus micaceus]
MIGLLQLRFPCRNMHEDLSLAVCGDRIRWTAGNIPYNGMPACDMLDRSRVRIPKEFEAPNLWVYIEARPRLRRLAQGKSYRCTVESIGRNICSDLEFFSSRGFGRSVLAGSCAGQSIYSLHSWPVVPLQVFESRFTPRWPHLCDN